MSLLILKSWEAVTTNIDSVRFFTRNSLMSPQKYFTTVS